MGIKRKLQNIRMINLCMKRAKIKSEYKKDAKYFCKNFAELETTEAQLEYKILLLVHSLEKGMCFDKLRPFGEEKVNNLIQYLVRYEEYEVKNSSAYKMGIAILYKWKNIWEQNDWEKTRAYENVCNFLQDKKEDKEYIVGAVEYTNADYDKYHNFDYLDVLTSRHSVRNYQKKKIKESDIKYCIECALQSPTACNRQMCKIYYVSNENKSAELSKAIIGLSGFNKDAVNFFVMTYDISAFFYHGERNQGFFNAGLVGMNFVNALHTRGIGSCFLQWSNSYKAENNIKKTLGIPENEKIAVVIGAGYYTEKTKVPVSKRKKLEEIYRVVN